MSARRRVFVTGIGVITPIGTGVDAFRAEAAGSPLSPIGGSTASIRPRSARRSRPRSTTSTPWHGSNRRSPGSSTGSASSASSPGGSRSTTRVVPGALNSPEPGAHRDLPRQRARRDRLRRVTARAVHGQGHPPGGAEPGAGGVRRRGPGQPRDRARRARPILSTAQLVRLGQRGARRGARGPARRPGRRGDRRGLRGA